MVLNKEKKRGKKRGVFFQQQLSRAKKKPCLDDRDADSPLDKDRDTIPGPEE